MWILEDSSQSSHIVKKEYKHSMVVEKDIRCISLGTKVLFNVYKLER